jgi:hypothetical protein
MSQATTPCPKCGTPNLRGTWVCSQCGNTLLVYCPNCHAGNEAGSQVCRSCHTPLAGPVQSAPQSYQQAPPYYQQQPQQYPPPQDYGAQGGQQQQPYPGYQQPPYPGFDQYQQYPGGYDPYGAYPPPQPADLVGKIQFFFDGLTAKLKQIVMTTNPLLLSMLVIVVVGMVVFVILAFQLGWIKTATPVKTVAVKDTSPVLISMLTIKEGASPNSAIISWITNKNSSSQVEYGIWPYANTTTPIEYDPRTGVNMGVMTHQVGLTNLIKKTSYSYRAISYDKDGNKGVSPDMQFDTTQ